MVTASRMVQSAPISTRLSPPAWRSAWGGPPITANG